MKISVLNRRRKRHRSCLFVKSRTDFERRDIIGRIKYILRVIEDAIRQVDYLCKIIVTITANNKESPREMLHQLLEIETAGVFGGMVSGVSLTRRKITRPSVIQDFLMSTIEGEYKYIEEVFNYLPRKNELKIEEIRSIINSLNLLREFYEGLSESLVTTRHK